MVETTARNTVGTKSRSAPRYSRKQPSVRRQQLIEAAIRCLGQGGMSAFTIDRIRAEAGVSRGLINHHFKGKGELLVRVYEAMTAYLVEAPPRSHAGADASSVERFNAMIEASFAPDAFDRTRLRAWLALWGEVSTNPKLRTLHRRRYRQYRRAIAAAISAIARERKRPVDSEGLAVMLIALIDGLWLEWCLDPSALSAADAKAACYDLMEPHLGPLSSPDATS